MTPTISQIPGPYLIVCIYDIYKYIKIAPIFILNMRTSSQKLCPFRHRCTNQINSKELLGKPNEIKRVSPLNLSYCLEIGTKNFQRE